MKKRNLYLILLCIVTIAAICYGTFIHVGKPFMDISDGSFSFVYGSEGNDKTQEKINAFSSAKISLSGADVVLSSGDGYSLTYVGEKSRFPAYSVENSVLTVSAKLSGEYGGNDVFIGVPSIIGRNGVKEVLELSLTDEERQKFDKSRQVLKESFEGLKL